MRKGTTKSGFEFEIDEKNLDDMRILDMAIALDEGDVTKISPLAKRVLGEKQRENLYRHLEEKEGRASIQRVVEEVIEIFTSVPIGKNSSPSPE